jgi:beta-propeller uncharacterized protein DUF5122
MRTFVLASLACVLVGCDGVHDAATTRDPNMFGLQAKQTGESAAASLTLPDTVSFDGAINAIQRAADGTLYVGGAFTRVGAVTGPAVPINATTGNLVTGALPRFLGQANAVVADGAGGWYVGGTFTVPAGGGQLTNLAHVLANNTIDASFHPNPDNAVLALAVSGTAVYAGGRFTLIGGETRNRLVAFNKSSGALLAWNPNLNNTVNTLLVSGATVYAGGAFTTVGTTTRNRLAAFNAADASTNPGTLLSWNPNANDVVSTLDIAGSTLYAGGSFTKIGDTSRRSLAAISATGVGTASAWDPNPTGSVTTLAVSSAGGTVTVYFSGSFGAVTDANGSSRVRNHLAAVNANGQVSGWDPAPNNPALALRILGSTVYVGGTFTALRGQMRYRLAAIGTDGTVLDWNPSAHDTVNALAVAGTGSNQVVYAGGAFPSVGGVARNFLAAIDANGTLLPWNPNANSIVQSLAVSGTTIYAGGAFTQVGGLNRSHLAAIGTDGMVSPTWAPAANSLVYAVVVAGNTLYVGGQFDAVNATTRNRLAAVDANPAGAGQLFLQWNPNVAGGAVYALTLADGVLYAGGNFTGVGGFTRSHLASVSADPNVAATVSNWNPNVADGAVFALASADGVVYVGGSFTGVGGFTRKFLAAIDASGDGHVRDWAPSANTYVTSFAISGSVIYVGGAFTAINGVKRTGLAAIGTSGNVLAFDPSANGVANSLVVSDNTVYAVGLFSSLAGTPHGHVGFIPAVPTFIVGGSLAGLRVGPVKAPVVLQNNGTNPLTLDHNGSFGFTAAVAAGDTYNVTVRVQPAGLPPQLCAVTNGVGPVNGIVTNIVVACTDPHLQAIPGVHSATLSWVAPPNATRFNLFVSSARNCDVANFASCPDGALLNDVNSPRTIANLRNGQPYFFRLETVFSNGARTLSNEAGARPNVLAFTSGDLTAPVRAIATGADGTVYIGGHFTNVGVMTGPFVPLDNDAGRAVPSDFPIVAGRIAAVVSDGAGGWYIGGGFEQVGALRRRHLARILADGTVAADFHPDPNGQVNALAFLRGVLYVSGDFSIIGSVERPQLAALDATGTPASWAPQVAGPVLALAAAGNTVYAGGSKSFGDLPPRSSLAAFSAADAPQPGATVPWVHASTAGPNTDDDFIRALAISGDSVLIGGFFDFIEGREHHNLAAVRTVESPGSNRVLDWRADADREVDAITVSPGRIHVGGEFQTINGHSHERIAAFAGFDKIAAPGDLLPWHPVVASSTLGSLAVRAIAASGGKVYFGGDFSLVNGAPRQNLAAVADDLDGTLQSWNPRADSTIMALAVSGDTVFAGGNFATLDGVQRNRLAAVDAQGALLPWNPNASFDVLALGVLRDVIYVGGNFSMLGDNTPRNGLAAVGADGALSFTFPLGVQGPARVFNTIAISRHPAASAQLDRIYAANGFEIAGFYPADASIDPGKRLDWNPAINGGTVSSLAWTDNSLYAGGDFTAIDGTARHSLALFNDAVNPDRPALLAWEVRAYNPSSTFVDVSTLAGASGVVYAAGTFTQLEDFFSGIFPRDGFGVTNSGATVQNWNAPPGRDPRIRVPSVHAIARFGDDIYLGGSFTLVGPFARRGLAKFNPDGTPDPAWHPTVGDVSAIAVGNSRVYVGGAFTTISDETRFGFAIVNADGSIAQ